MAAINCLLYLAVTAKPRMTSYINQGKTQRRIVAAASVLLDQALPTPNRAANPRERSAT